MIFYVQLAAAAMAAAGAAYWMLTLLAARRFARRPRPSASTDLPLVTVLKPLRGLDRGLDTCLRSHLDQDYPHYSVVFGLSDEEDPALDLVDTLLRHAEDRAHMVVTGKRGPNRKIGTLLGMEQMMGFAREAGTLRPPSILVINDSDIRVPPDYLTKVAAAFGDSKRAGGKEVGLVTCLYRGVPASTLGSRLEALGIAADFIPGVLTARLLEGGLGFALGSTMAVRADVLQNIGGLEPLLDYLADDYELGRRVRHAGYDVALADVVVETHLPAYTLGGFLRHQLRWARTIRAARPAGHFGLLVTFALPWSLVAVAASGAAAWSIGLLGASAGARFLSAWWMAARVLGDRPAVRNLWLLPLRDLLAPLLWLGAYTGRTVEWRGQRFRLEKGRLISLEPPEEQDDEEDEFVEE